jgi:hypothetical protein
MGLSASCDARDRRPNNNHNLGLHHRTGIAPEDPSITPTPVSRDTPGESACDNRMVMKPRVDGCLNNFIRTRLLGIRTTSITCGTRINFHIPIGDELLLVEQRSAEALRDTSEVCKPPNVVRRFLKFTADWFFANVDEQIGRREAWGLGTSNC